MDYKKKGALLAAFGALCTCAVIGLGIYIGEVWRDLGAAARGMSAGVLVASVLASSVTFGVGMTMWDS